MGGRLQRNKRRSYARKLESRFKPVKSYCPNCQSLLVNGGHFVPPSFGEEGFFICVKKV